MEELDWESNKEAIGCFVSNGGMKKLYVKTREWSDFTLGELTDGWQGLGVDGRGYHVFTKHWDYIEKPNNEKPNNGYVKGALLEVEDPTTGRWNAIKVLAITDKSLVVEFNNKDVLLSKDCNFRPITEKGVIIKDMIKICGEFDTLEGVCNALYEYWINKESEK